MITTLLLITALLIPGIMKAEDLKFPRPSQGATISQMVGLSKVTLSYHRPGVKERQIWGKLVPMDKVWRLGANEATTIEFNNDAKIEGQAIKAGKYALFAIPGKSEWTFIFSKQIKYFPEMKKRKSSRISDFDYSEAQPSHTPKAGSCCTRSSYTFINYWDASISMIADRLCIV